MNYANLDQDINLSLLLLDEEGVYTKEDYPYQDEMYKIIGACMEVHTVLGHGFLESVYHEALCIELEKRNIPFEQHKVLNEFHKDDQVKKHLEADIIAY